MYLPEQFRETDVDVMHELIRSFPLATVITFGDRGIEANHIPIVLDREPTPLGCLRGHVARNNMLWREHPADAEALFVFQAENSYITPSWYASKALDGKVVPTWNYACVHARGLLKIIDDPGWLLRQLEQLTAHNETLRSQPWSVSDAPTEYTNKLLAAIVGFEVVITDLQGKWKVSQNRPARDRQSVIAGLEGSGQTAMARLIRERGTGTG